MRRSSFQTVGLLALLVSFAGADVAWAQDEPGDADPSESPGEGDGVAQRKATATRLVNRGLMALTAGRYATAIELLELADRLTHSPVVLVALAEAYEKLGDLVKATELLDDVANAALGADASATYLAARVKARQRLSKLEQRIPKVRIVSGGAGARVRLDGRALSTEQLKRPVYVNPGMHIVVADTSECLAQQHTFEILEGGSETVTLGSPKAEAMATLPAAGPSDLRRWHLGATMLFALSGASTIAAIGTGVAAFSRNEDFDSQCPNNECPLAVIDEVHEAEALGTVAMVALGAGVLTATTGALMWWAGSRELTGPDVVVVAGPGSVGLTIRF